MQALEAAGVKHGDISVIASNADNRFDKDPKKNLIVDRDLDGSDDRAEAAGAGAGVGAAIGGAAGLLAGLGLLASIDDSLASFCRCFCRAILQSKQTTCRFIMLR